MWVRGLKPTVMPYTNNRTLVAPYVGAWIETSSNTMMLSTNPVAPYVGAWIETLIKRRLKLPR